MQENAIRAAWIAGVTFLAFALMHVTPLGSRLPSQVLGNLVGGVGLVAFAMRARRAGFVLARPNAALAGVFVWVLAGDAFLTYTEHSTVSLNVGLFVMLLAGALMLSWPALLLVLGAASAEGLFVASLVPGSHPTTQLMLEGAAAVLALVIHANRVATQRRLEGLLADEAARRVAVEQAMVDTRASEDRFRRFTESAAEGLVIHAEGRILDANPAFCRIVGEDPARLRGAPVARYFGDGSAAAWLAALPDGAVETVARRADGASVPVELNGRDLPYDGVTAHVLAVRDLTERRLAEAAVREHTVARRIVRRVLSSGRGPTSEVLAERRKLGRSIARETHASTLDEGLMTFSTLGLGELALTGRERDRWTFAGRDMLDLSPGSRMPGCAVALGYLEGLLTGIEGREMMGAELVCESQGHTACRFVAMPKARPQADTPSHDAPASGAR